MELDWALWIKISIAATMVTAVVGLVSLFFLADYFEQRKLIALSRAGSDAPAHQSGRAGAWLHAAEALGLKSIGYFLDREGVKSSYVTSLLSPNDRVLVSVSPWHRGKVQINEQTFGRPVAHYKRDCR